MEKANNVLEERNDTLGKEMYRITIIVKDEIIVEKFYQENVAKETIERMKELFPKMFVGGALEKKEKSWKVIWTLGNN